LPASVKNPEHYSSFDEATRAFYNEEAELNGISFVFTSEDPFCGIDLDDCRNPETGVIAPWAQEIIDLLDSYTEVSPSYTGVKIFIKARKDGVKCRTAYGTGEVEIYDSGRMFTFTSLHLPGTPVIVENRQSQLDELYATVFPVKDASTDERSHKASAPTNCEASELSDMEILELCRAAKNSQKFANLWDGKWTGVYPSQSEADSALACILAFYTRNENQLDSLFRESELYREKWDEQRGELTYGQGVIRNALDVVKALYGEKTCAPVSKPGADCMPARCDADDKKSLADQLVFCVEKTGADLFTDKESVGYVSINSDDHMETYPLDSKSFRLFLRGKYAKLFGKGINQTALDDAVQTLEAHALVGGDVRDVYCRKAHVGDVIYLDLGDKKWRCIEVTASGWKILTSHPVSFIRPKGMLPLPEPVQGGSISDLRPFLNMNDIGFDLTVSWILAALGPTQPYPILGYTGEQGSAKSSAVKTLRKLVDPHLAALRRPPRDEKDLSIAAANSFILAFDNLSGMSGVLSDAFCCLSTGGTFATRQLYTDKEESLLTSLTPLILNGVAEIGDRPDLLDRMISVTLEPIPDNMRRAEVEYNKAFAQVESQILGALLDVVVVGLKQLPSVKCSELPRMADFARWIVACSPALGWTDNYFLDAFKENRKHMGDQLLDSDPVVPVLMSVLDTYPELEITATELLNTLRGWGLCDSKAEVARTRQGGWPKGARALSVHLRRIAPLLRNEGIEFEFGSRDKRAIRIKKL
jgi:hypothetical protein